MKSVTTIRDKKGRKIYIGNFYFRKEFPDVKFPIKRRLISDVDLHLKLTKRGQVKRNDKEKQSILSRL